MTMLPRPIPPVPVNIPVRPPEDQKFFMIPGPYKLEGEKPNRDHVDVKRIYTVCEGKYYLNDFKGLMLKLDPIQHCYPPRIWMVTFDPDTNGEHVFREASDGQWLYHRDQGKGILDLFLEELQKPLPKYTPPKRF